MAVMAREAWTDHRLDDLNARVESIDRHMEAGFKEMREEFRAVRAEMKSEFQAVRGEMKGESQAIRGEVATGFAAVRSEMAAQAEMLNRTMYRLFGGMLVAWVVGVIAIIAQT
jgi:predicted phage gp36 major capsid-like protein